ncbi:MAG: TonB-dependent receptor [Bacteroidetes bacterium]|nr:MAG: TonB-dependent receptor [Bacteroidota bacterium]
MKNLILIILLLGLWISSAAQSSLTKIDSIFLSPAYSNLNWNKFIQKVEHNYDVRFYYDSSNFSNFQISFKGDSILLKKVLVDNLLAFNIFVSCDKKGNVFLNKNSRISTKLTVPFFKEANIDTAKKNIKESNNIIVQTPRKFTKQTIIIGSKEEGVNKQTATISGIAINSKTNSAIEGVTIKILNGKTGVVTDANGFYKITLSTGKHILKIGSVNIAEKTIEINLLSNGTLNLMLDDKIILLKDVVVSAKKNNKVAGTQMGLDKVITKNIKKLPLVFGEKDIIKVALFLPGVQSVGEGSSGFNVRGSPTDQNVFYINNVPIYNTSHLSGFFSAFNADVIDEFSLYKSNIPLQYGGRLSSVFEIKTKTGNNDKVTARGGLGLITGRLTVEGPLKKEKSNFLIGVRSTYSDWILNFIDDPIVKNSKAQFGDIVGNFSFHINENNQLNVFSYASTDKIDIFTQSKYDYQNYGGSVVWKHFFKNYNNLELSLAHSRYEFNEENDQLEIASYTLNNNLGHTEIKAIFDIKPFNNNHLQFGLNSTLYTINKGVYSPLSNDSYIKTTDLGKEKGIESALFISNEWKVNPSLTFSGGLRYNLYTYFGEQEVNKYRDGMPYTDENLVDVIYFDKWEAIKTYSGLDFRFAVNHLINDNLSVKAAYNRLHQFIYMLSSTIAVSPNYKWKLSDYNTKPIIGDQITLGLYSNLLKNRYELSVEAYYKFSQNIVEIKNGANLFFNENTEQATLQGNLNAFGIELMLKKLSGRLNGWINYTFSNSMVTVDSPFVENRINYGEPYPSNYDKPHAFNIITNYNFNRRTSISGNIVYATGRPITYPTTIYYYNDTPTLNYSERNAFRLPDYFRIDLSVNIEGNLLKRKLGHGSWAFSVYNVTGRKNAYSVYFKEEDGLIQAYKLSIFGAPIFSITYNFKLGNYNAKE